MGHNHSHHAPESYNKAFAISVALNLSFVIVQAIYAVTANSMSLLADAGHNLGDVLGLLFAWGANWLLTLDAGERFSYGHRRSTILAAIANALLLFATSALIAYEAVRKLLDPVAVNEIIVIAVALIGIVINGGTALLFLRGRHDDLNIKGAFLHLAYDALISFGVVVTGVMIYFFGWLWLDPLVAIGIVVAILLGTWGLLRDSVNLILDAVPHHIDQAGVKQYLKDLPYVTDFHDLHIWGLSTSESAMTVHLMIPDGALQDADLVQINHDLYERFRINHVTIQTERGDKNAPCPQISHC